MATYSFGQLEGLWINAGGSPALAPIMAAIALAESGGNPQSTNTTDNGGRQTSWGLWQLSDGTHNEPVSGILNPETNATQAVKKYKSQGLKAWGTYTSGIYRHFLKTGVAPVTTGLPSGSTSTATGQDAGFTTDIGGAIGSGFASAFSAIFKPFMEILIWGTETVIGGVLMVAGLLVMASYSKPVESLKSTIKGDALEVAAPEAAPEIEEERAAIAASNATRVAKKAGETDGKRDSGTDKS